MSEDPRADSPPAAPATGEAVRATTLPDLPPPRRGKVRDVYDLGENLLIVASDRLSAYDHILEPPIPGKGKVLTQLSNFWFARLQHVVPNHLVATEMEELPASLAAHHELLADRSILVRKAEVLPFECVARGFLAGSAYREYVDSGAVCGIALPFGLERASRLPEPIFTPATKATAGHDENVTFARLVADLGRATAERLRELTLRLFAEASTIVASRGLLLADTKFEFGWIAGTLCLVDEALTPDSSRYWSADEWRPGVEPFSFDKQYVRNWLDASGWDHDSAPPRLPAEVVAETSRRYQEAFRRLTGREPRL